jgi:flagellar FliL protein
MSPVEEEQVKAKLDDTELSTGSPRAMQKVELDLDDAPFLEEEVEAPAAVEELPTAPPPQEFEETPAPPLWKNKKILIGAGGILVLLGLAVWWFFLRAAPPAPPPPPPPPPPVEEAPKPEEPAPPPIPPDAFFPMDSFVVEKKDPAGGIKILTLKIKLVYKDDPKLAQELQAKRLILRDGLYYNLKNKSFANLTDKQSVDQLREELRAVVDNYLNAGQVDQVLFEELLVK